MSTLGTKIVIDGDSTGFERAAGRVGKAMNGLTGKISGDLKSLAAGYVSIQAFKTLILDVGKAALAIDDFADRQNTTFEETQRLIQAFKMFGLEAGDAEAALMKMASARKSAFVGDDDKLAAFNKYGVSMDDLNNASVTNFDLMKKIGVAMKDMKVNPAMMSDMQELFGKSGGKFIQGLKELGEGRAIKMISSEDIAAADRMEKAFESMKNSWNAIASKPIGAIAEAIEKLLKDAEDQTEKNIRGRGGRTSQQKELLRFAGVEEREIEEAPNLGLKVGAVAKGLNGLLAKIFTFGKYGDEKIAQAEAQFQATGMSEGVMGEAAEALLKKTKPETADQKSTGNLYPVNERAIKMAQEQAKVANAQADLDKIIEHALVAQLDPLDQNIAKRKEIRNLVDQSLQEKRKRTTEGDLESIKLQKEAVGIAAGLDSRTTPGIGPISIDSAAKANLGVGVQAYNPMIYNTQQNTNALKELTQTIKNIQDADSVPRADIATVFE